VALLTEARPAASGAVPPDDAWGRSERVALAVSAALGLFVFFWRLTTPSVVNDETIYRAASAQYVRGVFALNDEHPPLAKLIIGASHVLLGGGVFADRFAGALLGFATGLLVVATTYQVARSARAAVVGGLLWWLLPIAPGIVHVHVARMVTLEGPMLFFLAAATLAATVTARDPRLRWWLATGALAGLATSSKLTGVVAVAALLPVAVQQRHALARTAGHAAAAAAAFAAAFLLPYAVMGSQAPGVLRETFVFQLGHAADGHPQTVAGTIYLFQPWWAPFWFWAQYLGWPALVALVVLAVLGVLLLRRRPAVWPAAAVLAAAVLLVCSSPIKLPQYQDVWMPALCVLAGAAVAPALRHGARGLRAGVLVLLVPLAVAGAVQLASVATEGVEDYRAAGAFLNARVPPGEPITVWGDAAALGIVVTQNPLPEPLPPDGRPIALVVDPTIADRRPNEDVDGWLARHGEAYEAFRFQRLTVYVRR
jgi:4-amino-4-deoxy-L-arabinose transferase-like glycosyltransferase